MEFIHRPSSRIVHVDCLSRQTLTINVITAEDKLMYKQLMDVKLKEIAERVKTHGSKYFTLVDGLLFKRYRDKNLFVVPESMVNGVIRMHHDDMGHVGAEKTVHSILSYYWFLCLKQKIRQYIENCIKCLTYSLAAGKLKGELEIVEKYASPFCTLHVDHFGPLEETDNGHKEILVVIDAFTKFVWIFATKLTGADEVMSHLNSLFAIFGYPKRIISDRSTAYTST